MNTPIERLSNLVVGSVESVAPAEVKVLLDLDAPQATALNTGTPAAFPRLNEYVLIPNEAGATVAYITGIWIERSPYPKRSGMKDFGLIDLPFPLRKMSVTPVGTLSSRRDHLTGTTKYELSRGVTAFPGVGDQVLIPTSEQVAAIVGAKEGDRRVRVGSSPMASNAAIMVDPDKLFGRHLAVLGNTGSGKSCTVAGLIRWSLDAARKAMRKAKEGDEQTPNARFIVLDPNGEYARAFKDLNVRLFQVEGRYPAKPLTVPAWLWNGDEWAAFTGAAPGIQKPILFDALRRLKSEDGEPDAFETLVRGRVRRYRTATRMRIQAGDHLAAGRREGVALMLLNMAGDFEALLTGPEGELATGLRTVIESAREVENAARSGSNNRGGWWHNDFSEQSLASVQEALETAARLVHLSEEGAVVGEDIPRFFNAKELPGFVEALAADSSGRDVSQFVDSLNLRIRGLFAAGALASVADPGDTPSITLGDWLRGHIGDDQASTGAISVVDLSMVPSDGVHVVVAVLARMVFEAVQRYRRKNGTEIPTVLVLDEAHTFIHRNLMSEAATASGRSCCRTFERIAREGRKFGLGLVLASQRPSEVSPTVLSQCNTFILHRIVNDDDQDLVCRLVPDNVGGLIRELPSLPSQQAILLGWAAPIPVLVEIDELPDSHRPHSADPDFWDVWTKAEERRIDWDAIANEWQGEDNP